MKIRITLLAAAAAMAVAGCKKIEEHQAAPSAKDGHAQHAHHESKHHKDPGPRNLSLQARMAERSAAERAISWPDPADNDQPITQEDGTVVHLLTMADGEKKPYQGWWGPRPRSDVLSPLDVATHRKDMQVIHAQSDHAAHGHCLANYNERIGVYRSMEWLMGLHYVATRTADGERHMVVDDVEHFDPPAELLAEPGQETLRCLESLFRGLETTDDWPSVPEEVAQLTREQGTVSWRMCVQPHPSVAMKEED